MTKLENDFLAFLQEQLHNNDVDTLMKIKPLIDAGQNDEAREALRKVCIDLTERIGWINGLRNVLLYGPEYHDFLREKGQIPEEVYEKSYLVYE